MKVFDALLVLIVLVVVTVGTVYIVKNDGVKAFLSAEILSDEDDDDEANTEGEKIYIVDGYKAIKLDEEQLETVGISSEQLSSTQFMPELGAYGEVVDIAPLVTLKTEYVNQLAEKKIVQNALKNLQANLGRSRALHEARSLSTNELERHRAEVDEKQAELNAMQTRLENLEYKIKSEWGDVIGSLVLEQDKKTAFNRLAMHKDSLVMLSLPKNKTLTDTGQSVYVSHTNRRNEAVLAAYLDVASKAANPLYGESYFYLIESEKLRPGMRLFAWVEETSESLKGLFVPENAVVWYANEPWIYSQQGENIFIRKPLTNAVKLEQGWFVTNGIEADERIVISGSQTLLSEEFKWAIPDEDDD